ncbi:MAG: hypothetical protein ACLKAK_12940 [Alkaliphilus sp.]
MRKGNSVNKLVKSIKSCDQENQKVYHDAHLLLKIYADVVWRTKEGYANVVNEQEEIYGATSLAVIEVITDFGSSMKAKLLQEQLEDIETSKVIIDIVNSAMRKLKTYPCKGMCYYNILEVTFFAESKYSETEILETLDVSRSTYYRQKKKAIALFGVVLWGYILKDIVESLDVSNSVI